jgi:hypothetical protein
VWGVETPKRSPRPTHSDSRPSLARPGSGPQFSDSSLRDFDSRKCGLPHLRTSVARCQQRAQKTRGDERSRAEKGGWASDSIDASDGGFDPRDAPRRPTGLGCMALAPWRPARAGRAGHPPGIMARSGQSPAFNSPPGDGCCPAGCSPRYSPRDLPVRVPSIHALPGVSRSWVRGRRSPGGGRRLSHKLR